MGGLGWVGGGGRPMCDNIRESELLWSAQLVRRLVRWGGGGGEGVVAMCGGERGVNNLFWWPFIGVDFAFGTSYQWPLAALEGWPLVRGKYRKKTVRAFIFWPHKRGGRW